MKKYLIFLAFLCSNSLNAQDFQPSANIRLSFLLFPFSPLLTMEVRSFGNTTLQLESNFKNTHGANIKYFTNKRMSGHYMLIGTAFVQNKLLRKDEMSTILPYLGYGYARWFGASNKWTFDSRIGLGLTINADKNSVYPILKTGIGRLF